MAKPTAQSYQTEFSLSAQWVGKDMDDEASDQTGQMPRLIGVFAVVQMPFCWFCHQLYVYVTLISCKVTKL